MDKNIHEINQMNLDFRIESKRLEFKSPSENDCKGFSALIQENKDLVCGFFGSGLLGKDDFGNLYKLINKNEFLSNRIILSIYSKLTGMFIGLCGLETDSIGFKGKLFYVLLSHYQGNGYAIESIKLLLNLAFSRLDLNQVIAEIPNDLRNAWKPAERAGLRYMGEFRDLNQDFRFLLFVIDKKEYLNQLLY